MANNEDAQDPTLRAMRDLTEALERNTDALKSSGGGGGSSGSGSGFSGRGGKAGLAKALAGGGAGAALGARLGPAGVIAGKVYDSTIGFAVNATLKAGKKAVREAAGSALSNATVFGGQVSAGAIGTEALGAGLETLPFFGRLVGDVRQPRLRAADRLKGELALSFRLGGAGAVPDEFLKERFDQLKREEENFVEGGRRIDALSLQNASDTNEAGKIFEQMAQGIDNLVAIATEVWGGSSAASNSARRRAGG